MSEGFYCNRDIIVQSFGSGEMYCAISQQSVVGFVLHTLKTAGSSIDILEIRPSHRRRGFGKQLALDATDRLFKSGAASVTVKCAPRSSETFWRRLGFVSVIPPPSSREPLLLVLRNTA